MVGCISQVRAMNFWIQPKDLTKSPTLFVEFAVNSTAACTSTDSPSTPKKGNMIVFVFPELSGC